MTAREEAQRFLDQLRAQTDPSFGWVDAARAKDVVDQFLRESIPPEQRRDPLFREQWKQGVTDRLRDIDGALAEHLARMQANIERTAAARAGGADFDSPLVGYLRTGQLNAVSLPVPGRSDAYLVLFEDQMLAFIHILADAIVWALPRDPDGADGEVQFGLRAAAVAERIAADATVVGTFAALVGSYTVMGRIMSVGTRLPPDRYPLARQLSTSISYFVLGHEYAHVLLGHLDTTTSRAGVLPATDVETLAYSWQQEAHADELGTHLSINALIEHERQTLPVAFAGSCLFFDAVDVMDRAVALLQTGDENARQLGSHPPAGLRKQRLRDVLPQMAKGDPATLDLVRGALVLADLLEEIVRLLWERTRPVLVDLRDQGVSAAPTWRTVPKETSG
ncbi:hypothetical protein [Actinophytocola sp.]|uniref:hypothetical protein n=1 Tax=Actinophytocola sp. TaxID=1872138 RepID=UPI002ED148B8